MGEKATKLAAERQSRKEATHHTARSGMLEDDLGHREWDK